MRLDGEKRGRSMGYGLVTNNIILKQLPEKLADDGAYDVSTDQRKIKKGA